MFHASQTSAGLRAPMAAGAVKGPCAMHAKTGPCCSCCRFGLGRGEGHREGSRHGPGGGGRLPGWQGRGWPKKGHIWQANFEDPKGWLCLQLRLSACPLLQLMTQASPQQVGARGLSAPALATSSSCPFLRSPVTPRPLILIASQGPPPSGPCRVGLAE